MSILVKSGPIGDDFANDQKNRNNLLNDYDFVEDYDYLTGFDAQGTDFKIRMDLVSKFYDIDILNLSRNPYNRVLKIKTSRLKNFHLSEKHLNTK